VTVVAMASSIGCSQSEGPAAAEGTSSRVTQAAAEREEFECDLTNGEIIRVYPASSELHRINPNLGTWSMQDGLKIAESDLLLTIDDDKGKSVGTISSHGYYAEEDGKPLTGPCERSYVKTVKPTLAPVAIDDKLEYSCKSEGDAVDYVVRPKVGEVDMIRVRDGRFYGLSGIHFEAKSVATSPAKNVISGATQDGTPVEIVETDSGITITEAQIQGTCEKLERRY
jgi:hypothetical protein